MIGLSEVRRNEETQTEMKNGYILMHSAGDNGQFGTGFIVKSEHKDKIEEFFPISKRISALKLVFSNKIYLIIEAHAPTTAHDPKDIEAFYNQLEDIIKQLKPGTHQMILIGDFNASIGKREPHDCNIMGTMSKGSRNKSGEILISFCHRMELSVIHSYHNFKWEDRWTWKAPNEKTYEIDYFFTHNKNIVKSFEIVKKFNFESDHRLLLSSICIGKNNKNKINRTEKSLHIKSSADKYREHLREEIKELDWNRYNIQETYNSLVNAIKTATTNENKHTPNPAPKHRSKKISDSTKELIEKREMFNRIKDKTSIQKIEHAKIRKLTRKKIREDIQKYEEEMIEKIILSSGSTKKLQKELTIVKKSWIHKITSEEGKEYLKREDIAEEARKYYMKLYDSTDSEQSRKIRIELNDQNLAQVLPSEVEKAINELKKGKAPGGDKITNELIIEGKSALIKPIQTLFSRMISECKVPDEWLLSKIILLHKKGPRDKIGNYRPITLSPILYKMFAKIIQARIKKVIHENQPEEQAGFRPSYSTFDHLQTINQIIEKSKEYQIELFIAFVDYSKAFDSIQHSSIWEALEMIHLEPTYINILKQIYSNNKGFISLDQNSKTFPIKKGTKQGCPISPDVFNTVLELIFRNIMKNPKWSKYGIKIDGQYLSHLRFADDIVIFSDKAVDLANMLSDLEEESKQHGLYMNKEKTQILSQNKFTKICINGVEIKNVPEYVYLGQIISFQDKSKKEIARRTNLGWKKYWALKNIFKSRTSKTLKSKVMKSCVFPTLIYGSQTWALTQAQQQKLQSTQQSMQRSMLSIKRSQKISNKTINQELDISQIMMEARKSKWMWAGHVCRMESQRWAKRATEWTPLNNKRKVGRPAKRWRDEFMKEVGPNWPRLARDRKSWKSITKAIVN